MFDNGPRTVLNRCERPVGIIVSPLERATRLDWAIAIFLVIVQQNAFAATFYEVLHPGDSLQGVDNVFNTASILISIILLAIGSTRTSSIARPLSQESLCDPVYTDRSMLSHLVRASRFDDTKRMRLCSDYWDCRLYCGALHDGASAAGPCEKL